MRVKTIEEIRYENFLILVEEAGSVALFAKKMEKGYGVFSQIKNKSLESKTGNPKGIGSKQAREIEIAFKRDIGWMDHEQLDQEALAFKQLPAELRAWILKGTPPSFTSVIPTTKDVDTNESKPIESDDPPSRRKGEINYDGPIDYQHVFEEETYRRRKTD